MSSGTALALCAELAGSFNSTATDLTAQAMAIATQATNIENACMSLITANTG
jgi:hypothetical protein